MSRPQPADRITDPRRFADFAGIPVAEAVLILERERRDRAAHGGRAVMMGYDYNQQTWCACAYCESHRVVKLRTEAD